MSEDVLQGRIFILRLFFAVKGTSYLLPSNKEQSSSTILIVGLCLGVLALATCVVIGLLRYRRSRRAKEVNLSDIYMTYRCEGPQ